MTKNWRLLISFLVLLLPSVSVAQANKSGPDFQSKFDTLAKNPTDLVLVNAQPGEELSEATLEASLYPDAKEMLGRSAKAKSLLDNNEIKGVVLRNKLTIKYCYLQALKKNPKFQCQAVVGVQIKTSGQVSKVEIDPDEIAQSEFGKCLALRVNKWMFPSFSGQKSDGTRVTSIGYEFPLQLSQAK